MEGQRRKVSHKEKSAEAIVPAGKKDEPGRAERTSRGCLDVLERSDDGSQPEDGAYGDEQKVKPDASARAELSPAAPVPDSHPAPVDLWRDFSREKSVRALKRVEQNNGAPGPDGMKTEELRPWLHVHWPEVRARLDAGTYRPSPVRRVFIPKPAARCAVWGCRRCLTGLIQQALLQVLTPIFDPHFSEAKLRLSSRALGHQAVRAAQRSHRRRSCGWVVDLDLEAFFDRVNHDALMARCARADRRQEGA